MTSVLLPAIFHKHILQYIQPSQTDASSLALNASLHEYLQHAKARIDGQEEKWDKYKRYTNPYEFIDTVIPNTKCKVSSLNTLSRSFYKMIELMQSLELDLSLRKHTNLRSFHLAEGPGGFIEAMVYLRGAMTSNDVYYGMTLVNDADHTVPGWRKSAEFLAKHPQVKIEVGADGTGDLLNPANLAYVYQHYGSTMDIVTADGGFDFTANYNTQEEVSGSLILAQLAFAVALQKPHGHFVLKVFDLFSALSIDLMFLLTNLYEEVHVVKPATSRLANSEKYIVCKGFRLPPGQRVDELVRRFMDILSDPTTAASMQRLLTCDIPLAFRQKLEECNLVMGQAQLENLISTLNLMEHGGNRLEKLDTLKRQHVTKCTTWCQRYNIPYHAQFQTHNIFRPTVVSNYRPRHTSETAAATASVGPATPEVPMTVA